MWFIIAVALIVVAYLVWRAKESSNGTNNERPQRTRSSGHAGHVGGRHFTSYVETVKSLKREGRSNTMKHLSFSRLSSRGRKLNLVGVEWERWLSSCCNARARRLRRSSQCGFGS